MTAKHRTHHEAAPSRTAQPAAIRQGANGGMPTRVPRSDPQSAIPHDVLRLQRLAGNRAVLRILQSPPHHNTAPIPAIQRFEAGEHTRIADAEIQYTVKKGDIAGAEGASGETVDAIGATFGVTPMAVRDANKETVRAQKKPDGDFLWFFDFDVMITIPALSADSGSPAPGGTIDVKGVSFTHGQMIALGDFYATPAEMLSAPKTELEQLKVLIIKDQESPGIVKTEEWKGVLGARYDTLLEDNASHFAPSDPALIEAGGNSRADNKSEWEKVHKQALDAAVTGARDDALMINAFGDHFLTDAFAAGHLFNKQDLMDHFAGKLAGNEEAFFTTVANGAWSDPKVSEYVSGFETTDTAGWNINSADRFKSLLVTAHQELPTKVPNAVVNVVHNRLNTDGVQVTNGLGATWKLSGDKSLDAETLSEARQAVVQSQQNVLGALSAKKAEHAALCDAVWAHVPRPNAEGAASIQQAVQALADPAKKSTTDAAAAFVIANIGDIIGGAVDMKKLAPAGKW